MHDFQLRSGNPAHPAPKVPRPPDVGELWHNAFAEQVDAQPKADHQPAGRHGRGARLPAPTTAIATSPSTTATSAPASTRASSSRAGRAPSSSGIPLNRAFDGKLAMVRDGQARSTLGSLSLTVIGPFEEDLDALREEWNDVAEEEPAPARPARAHGCGPTSQRLGASEVELFRASLALQADELGDRDQGDGAQPRLADAAGPRRTASASC